jgi:transposase
MAHVDTRTLSPQELERIRRRGIELVLGGMSQAEAARMVSVTNATMCSWVKRYRKSGDQGLKDRQRGKPRTTLTAVQERRLRRKIIGNTPGQLRLDFALWTTAAVMVLIKTLFSKQVSKRTVHRLLFSWGFTPKKGTRRAWQQDTEAVARWVHHEYPAIAARAKRENGRIFWGDETGLRSDDGTTVGWSLKGEPAIAAVNGKRYWCNVISVIDNQGGLAFHVFKGGFRTPIFIAFMKQLILYAKGKKVFLILDRHPVHCSKAVRKWVSEREKQIELFYMPGYSPELNPDEYLNHDLKAQTVRKRPPRDANHLVSMVRGHLRSRQRQPRTVANFFKAPFVRYAAA